MVKISELIDTQAWDFGMWYRSDLGHLTVMAIQRRTFPPTSLSRPTTLQTDGYHGWQHPPPFNLFSSFKQHFSPKDNRDYERIAKIYSPDRSARNHQKNIESSARDNTDEEGFTTFSSKKMKCLMNRQKQLRPPSIEPKRFDFSQKTMRIGPHMQITEIKTN